MTACVSAMTMTPRSHHKGTSGFGGKASMTPCNARAKGKGQGHLSNCLSIPNTSLVYACPCATLLYLKRAGLAWYAILVG